MDSKAPRVSIGMPVYNGERHLEEAIDSIVAQTFGDFELIISDNASSDRTEEICRNYAARDPRIRYERQNRNLGAAANFNTVFRMARAPYFKWMAHDDLLAPTYLEYCVAVLDQEPECVLCFPGRYWMTHDGTVLGRREPTREGRRSFHHISYPRVVALPGADYPMIVFGLARRDVLEKTNLIGAYNSADLVIVAELRLQGAFWEIPERLYFQRLHDESAQYVARMTTRGEALWYDPNRRHGTLWPSLKVTTEQLKAVFAASISWPCKLRYAMATVLGRPRAGVQLALQPWSIWFWGTWSKWSVSAAQMSRSMSTGLRLWSFFAGLRRMDLVNLRSAFSRPWFRQNMRLLQFAAQRLARRSDPHARQLLTSWLQGSCPARRTAAFKAMSVYPDYYASLLADYRECPKSGVVELVVPPSLQGGNAADPKKGSSLLETPA